MAKSTLIGEILEAIDREQVTQKDAAKVAHLPMDKQAILLDAVLRGKCDTLSEALIMAIGEPKDEDEIAFDGPQVLTGKMVQNQSFTIDPEFKSYMTTQTPEAVNELKSLIKSSKHIDPLVVLVVGDQKLLGDGHTRLAICEELGLPYQLRFLKMANRAEALSWIIRNQLGRRNLTDERKSYFIGKLYLNTKMPHGQNRTAQNEQSEGGTASTIANAHGASAATVRRDAEFAAAVDAVGATHGEEAKEEILSGASGKTKADVVKNSPKMCASCQRCVRTGQELPKLCKDCKELNKPKEKKGPKKPKPGAPIYDDKIITDLIGKLIRAIDDRGGKVNKNAKYHACVKAMEGIEAAWRQWYSDK